MSLVWVASSPTLGSIITSLTLLVTLIGLFMPERHSTDVDRPLEGYLAIDTTQFPCGSRIFYEDSYNGRMKAWELLELIEERVPLATPSNYGKTWLLKDAGTGREFRGFGALIREQRYLEEEAKSLKQLGISPNTTLQVLPIDS